MTFSHHELISRNQDLVNRFLDIAERKVSVLDDYGDERWDVLTDEVRLCIKKIAQREGLTNKWNDAQYFARSCRKPDRLRPGRSYGKEAELRSLVFHLGYHGLDETLTQLFREHHEFQKTITRNRVDFDNLSGAEFETLIAKRLTAAGYDVAGTPSSGDQGADLI